MSNIYESKWPIEEPISEETIKERTNLARVFTYNTILSARDDSSVYIEDIVNIFIALIQKPVNFILFDRNKKPITHFCKDIVHKTLFETFIRMTLGA